MIVITGPTSSGKTSLALKLCKEFGRDIISADSRQVYKHFDIGTGKMPAISEPSEGYPFFVQKNELFWTINETKIWMYDVVEPQDPYSVNAFRTDVQTRIPPNKDYFIVGGTGLYVDALLGLPTSSEPPPDWQLRETLKDKTVEELRHMLNNKTLEGLNESDAQNPRRLIRRIEQQSANSLQIKQKNDIDKAGIFSKIMILKWPREEIYKRADLWVDQIWPYLIDEVIKLKDFGYQNAIPMKGIIYETLINYIEKRVALLDACQRIKFDLHQYIKRQETWFKKYEPYATILDPSSLNFDSQVFKIVESMQKSERIKR